MNQVKRELIANMRDNHRADDGCCEAVFYFSEDFVAFKGHFPGNSVVPGICLIQSVVVMLENFYKARFIVHKVTAAKFFAPVTACQEVFFQAVLCEQGSENFTVLVRISRQEQKIAQFELKMKTGE